MVARKWVLVSRPADSRLCTRGWMRRGLSLSRRQSCHRGQASYCHQLGSLAPSHDGCALPRCLERVSCAENASNLKRDSIRYGPAQKDRGTPRNHKTLADNQWASVQPRCHSRPQLLDFADMRTWASPPQQSQQCLKSAPLRKL